MEELTLINEEVKQRESATEVMSQIKDFIIVNQQDYNNAATFFSIFL